MAGRALSAGREGEQRALAFYEAAGYTLVQANFRTRHGEIDLIVRKGDTLVFAEVKARGPRALDTPAAWVDERKQAKIRTAALLYLQAQGLSEASLRFDVVEVLLSGQGGAEIHCIENAF